VRNQAAQAGDRIDPIIPRDGALNFQPVSNGTIYLSGFFGQRIFGLKFWATCLYRDRSDRPMADRLQKVLSQRGIASRRQAETMIRSGRVSVNGLIAQIGDTVDPQLALIEIDGLLLPPQLSHQYLLLNKPCGVVSTCADPQGRTTVLDLLPEAWRQGTGIHPVGRLDTNSTGAILLTNDGELTFRLTHPSHQISKTYNVLVAGHPQPLTLAAWRTGILLEGRKTLPAQVKRLSQDRQNTRLQIVLREGRNRQIRKVADLLGHPVLALERIAIGSITLQLPDRPLARGGYRHLTCLEAEWLSKILNYKLMPS
jgi:pseudouridine synthase